MAIDYDDHHHHSAYLILNSGLAGYTSREQVIIALLARYHRKGDPDVSSLGDLAKKGDKGRVRLLSGIIRLAEQFERSRDQSVKSVDVSVPNGKVVLRPKIRGATPACRCGQHAATPACWRRPSTARWRSRGTS